MKKPLFVLIPLLLLLTACGTNKNSANTGGNTPEGEQEEEITGNKVTFTFLGASDREGWSSGSGVFDSGDSPAKNALINLFGEYMDPEDPSCITGNSCTMLYVGKNEADYTSLTVGTASSAGNIEFKFKYDILKVDFSLQTYYKEYPGGVSVDTNAMLCIEDQTVNMSMSEPAVPGIIVGSYKYDNKKKTLKFYNEEDHQRVYIHELTITFAEE